VNSKQLKPFIPLILSLLLALVLVFIVEDFVQTVIVAPLLYAIWFVSLIVRSLPQGVLWAGFIFVMLIVSFANLPKGKTPGSSTWHPPARKSGQVERWTQLLENTQRTRFSKWRLAQELKRLARNLQSPLDGEGWRSVDRVDLELPSEITAFFEARQPSHYPFWKRLISASEETETALDLDPEVVIQFLEERLKL